AEMSAETPDPWGKGWLMAGALIAVVILTTAALGAWLHRRHGAKHPNEHPAQTVLGASAPEAPIKAEGIPPAISFPGPGCQKSLRAKTALAGKKLKCPQCGGAVLVPSIRS